MSLKQQLDRFGATPGKLAIVGALVIVLLVVVVPQFWVGESHHLSPRQVSTSQSSASSQQTIQQQTETQQEQSTSEPKQRKEPSHWPEFDLSQTLSSDPFAMPEWAVPESREASDTDNKPSLLADLQKQGVSIVVIASGEKTAKIGEQSVRVGDVLEGYRITDITPQGILLDKLEPK